MRRLICLAVAALWLAGVSAAFAYPEYVEEAWRSPGGTLRGSQVDDGDGSLWLIEGATVTHWSRDGGVLGRSPALCQPRALAPNPADGSCWVSQGSSAGVVHLASDARVLSVTSGFDDVVALTLSPSDGSVWVTHRADDAPDGCILSHISASGQEFVRWELPGTQAYYSRLVVDPTDGSLTVFSASGVIRASADGTRLWEATGSYSHLGGDVDPGDQSVWVATGGSTVAHLSADGALLWQSGDLTSGPRTAEIHVSHADRSVWVTFGTYYSTILGARGDEWVPSSQIVHLDASGAALPAPTGFLQFCNDLDGSIWVAWQGKMTHYSSNVQALGVFNASFPATAYDQAHNSFWSLDDLGLRYLRSTGTVLWQQWRPSGLQLASRSVNAQDGSVWVVDRDGLVRLSPNGQVLERRGVPIENFRSLTVSPYDGTWWVSDWGTLTHLSANGAQLSQYAAPSGWVSEPAIDPADGSLWAVWNDESTETGPRAFVSHLGRDGALLWTVEYPVKMTGPALAADGSAWVVSASPDESTHTIAHLSATGAPLGTPVALPAELIGRYVGALGLLPTDGSFLMSGLRFPISFDSPSGWVCRVAADGSLLWKDGGLYSPGSIALSPVDGSLWVADAGASYSYEPGSHSAVRHYAADGTELWRSGAFDEPSTLALDPRDGSVWISDDEDEQIVHLRVTGTGPFADVLEGSWACAAIAACLDAGIVEGFPGGNYRPDLEVTRGQMAVYIGRALALPTGAAALPTGPAEPTFPDVDAEHWAYQYVEYCYAQGIVQGFPGGNYQPHMPVNRGQMAVYIARSQVTPSGDAGLPEPPAAPTFPDVTAENDWSWCYPHVEYCAAKGIVQGYWDGYHPERVVTRDQMAVYIARAFELPL